MATATKKASVDDHVSTKDGESKFSKAFQFSPDITKVSSAQKSRRYWQQLAITVLKQYD